MYKVNLAENRLVRLGKRRFSELKVRIQSRR